MATNHESNHNTETIAPVPVVIAGLLTDDATNNPVVVLKDKEGERVLLMWVGDAEAQAIDLASKKMNIARPLTHTLTAAIIKKMGGTLERVIIDRLEQGTYCASLYIHSQFGYTIVDARPSDSIVLALETNAPLFIDRVLFNKASTILKPDSNMSSKKKKSSNNQIEISIAFVPGVPEVKESEESFRAKEVQNAISAPLTLQNQLSELTSEDKERIKKHFAEAQKREQGSVNE